MTTGSDPIDAAMQRNDVLDVIGRSLASCQPYGPPFHVDPGELLRNIEECGYTFRLTTHEERRSKNDQFGPSR